MLIFGDKPPVSAGGFYLLDCLLNLTPVGHCELATERRMVGRFQLWRGIIRKGCASEHLDTVCWFQQAQTPQLRRCR